MVPPLLAGSYSPRTSSQVCPGDIGSITPLAWSGSAGYLTTLPASGRVLVPVYITALPRYASKGSASGYVLAYSAWACGKDMGGWAMDIWVWIMVLRDLFLTKSQSPRLPMPLIFSHLMDDGSTQNPPSNSSKGSSLVGRITRLYGSSPVSLAQCWTMAWTYSGRSHCSGGSWRLLHASAY